jgi:hypothetical protein
MSGSEVLSALRPLCMVIAAALGTVAADSGAKPHRSRAQVAAFRKAHPCPSTGRSYGRCPGYIVDHVQPLCAGGPDRPSNMQWQTVAEAKAKDRLERQECERRRMRTGSLLGAGLGEGGPRLSASASSDGGAG